MPGIDHRWRYRRGITNWGFLSEIFGISKRKIIIADILKLGKRFHAKDTKEAEAAEDLIDPQSFGG
ncbi:MAG: hypothetical protein EA411_04030 [Saprospirales bacterium]|nr:MAG: hypothetical protein EA411_04030 [Saprospirales bacterium]